MARGRPGGNDAGASRSMGRELVDAMGPLSSIGCPTCVHHAAIMPSPPARSDGARGFHLVAFAQFGIGRPELPRPLNPLRGSGPIPAMPCGKLSSSPAITLSSPWRRAMPSAHAT